MIASLQLRTNYKEGVSLKPVFLGQKINRNQPLFWEHEGNRAIRDGKWKLVAERSEEWQLFDLEKDRSELHNVASQNQQVVAELKTKYEAWYKRVNAEPFNQPLNKWFYDYNSLQGKPAKSK